MSTTHGTIEPTPGAPVGALPQLPGAGRAPLDEPESFARSGDTDVVFRLERDVPLLHRLRELASTAVDRLFESWRMVVAGGVCLAAVVTLAVMVGGAYGRRPPSPSPGVTSTPPAPPPPPVQPTPETVPAVAAPAIEPAPPARPPARHRPLRGHSAGAKKAATPVRPGMPAAGRHR